MKSTVEEVLQSSLAIFTATRIVPFIALGAIGYKMDKKNKHDNMCMGLALALACTSLSRLSSGLFSGSAFVWFSASSGLLSLAINYGFDCKEKSHNAFILGASAGAIICTDMPLLFSTLLNTIGSVNNWAAAR